MLNGAQYTFQLQWQKSTMEGRGKYMAQGPKLSIVRLHLQKDRLGIWRSILMVRNKSKSISRVGINFRKAAPLTPSGWEDLGNINLPPSCQIKGSYRSLLLLGGVAFNIGGNWGISFSEDLWWALLRTYSVGPMHSAILVTIATLFMLITQAMGSWKENMLASTR